MSAEPAQDQNSREREQPGKPGMKGESKAPANRTQPGNTAQGQAGSQPERQSQGLSEQAADENRAGQAQNRESPSQAGQRQMTRQNVRTTGKTNLAHDKAARVAQTLMTSGSVQKSPNINVSQVNVGVDLPGDAVINPLPPAIVEIVPEFRGYDYFIVGDEVVIVDPASRQVVEIIEDVG
jgi:hypothetical protein